MSATSSNIKRLTRLDVKNLMQQHWGEYLKLLKFPAHLLVIGTPHRSSAPPSVLIADSSRFAGKRLDYYFIVAYFDYSYDYKNYFLISHETIVHFNSDSPSNRWRVPLYLCQEETQFMRKTAFTHYQDDEFKVPPNYAIELLQRSFDERRKLYRWFAKDVAYQDANPLDDFDLTYARDAPHIKVPDQLCYFLLTKHMTASQYMCWIEGEVALMRHKIYLRPRLGNRVCAMTLAPTLEMENAIRGLRKFHQINWERIKKLDWPFLSDPDAQEMVVKFFDAIEKETKEELEQQEARADAKRILSKKVLTPEVTPKQQIFMADIRSCAPKCVARLMNAAFGTDKERARMPDVNRLYLNRILIEHRVTAYDIEDIMRPLSMSAYRDERPNRTWEELKDGIATAAEDVDTFAKSGQYHVSCEDMMKFNLCPHLVAAPTVRMRWEDRMRIRRAAFIKAKQTCHADLELMREARTRTAPHRGSIDWIKSPWAFTRVVMVGNQGNPDRKYKPRNGAPAAAAAAASSSSAAAASSTAGTIEYTIEEEVEENEQ